MYVIRHGGRARESMLKHRATLLIVFLLANCASRTITFEVPPGYVFKLRLSQTPVLGERVRSAVQLISAGDTLFSGELPESGPTEFPLHIMFVTARDPALKVILSDRQSGCILSLRGSQRVAIGCTKDKSALSSDELPPQKLHNLKC